MLRVRDGEVEKLGVCWGEEGLFMNLSLRRPARKDRTDLCRICNRQLSSPVCGPNACTERKKALPERGCGPAARLAWDNFLLHMQHYFVQAGTWSQCTLSKSWRLFIMAFAACAKFLRRAFSSSLRDAGAGRGPRRGVSSENVPPLPGPLLHPMEERDFLRLRLCGPESIRGKTFLERSGIRQIK